MIALTDVSKSYAGADRVLDNVSFSVDRGKTVAIVGPSGCGKSTLLNLLGALDTADSGQVEVAGRRLGQLDSKELARFRCRHVGFVFQLHHLLPQYNVLQNVVIPTLAPGGRREGAEDRARDLLGQVGLADKVSRNPGGLSGGERQRVAVVRALINQPEVLLADEPTGSLSHEGAEALIDLLVEMASSKEMTLVTVTHAPDVAARMQTVYELRDGKLKRRE